MAGTGGSTTRDGIDREDTNVGSDSVVGNNDSDPTVDTGISLQDSSNDELSPSAGRNSNGDRDSGTSEDNKSSEGDGSGAGVGSENATGSGKGTSGGAGRGASSGRRM